MKSDHLFSKFEKSPSFDQHSFSCISTGNPSGGEYDISKSPSYPLPELPSPTYPDNPPEGNSMVSSGQSDPEGYHDTEPVDN